ncbi:putative glycolipid-binding domain-containing protein [Massilia putida]|uniref:putative glycolipid-binding domain-containing protein n=1 Tax=Massilia putida TaxID=1141883 RepID=UPI000951A873|nr:putative glycolipid-binding domain-containing protein [Massilia putida]
MNRSYRWATEQSGGLEHVELDIGDAGATAEGVLIGPAGGRLFACSYALCCDEHWRVRSLDVHVAGKGRVCLRADGAGNWTQADGTPLPALQGCTDVDLSGSPFTNTLPIRRLGEQLQQRQEIRVAYVDLPKLDVQPVAQAYTRLAQDRVRFESLSRPFTAELEIDGDGLVLHYPGLFTRVAG